jgi:hypothetical protein
VNAYVREEKMRARLKVGVLIDSNLIPNWAFKMLGQIVGSNYAEIVLIVKNGTPIAPPKNIFRKIRDNPRNLLYAALTKLDERVKTLGPNAFSSKDIYQLLPNVPSVSIKPIQKEFSDYLTRDDVLKIKSSNIDVLIRLGFRILRGEVLSCARCGVWSYHHGDNRINRGGPAGFWEVLEGWPETGSILQILTEDLDNGKVLYRSYSRTDNRSIIRNKNNYYWKGISFLPRKLEELYELGEGEFLSRIRQDNQHPSFYSRRRYTAPKNIQLIGLALKHYSKCIFKKLQSLYYFDQWMLLYRINRNTEFSSSFWRFKKIIPPKDRFWADPFIVFENGKYYIFIEEFIYKSNKGHISYLIMDKYGNFSTPKIAIDKPYHLSYPFVFHHNGEYYMIPETSNNRTIDLYKCIGFPDRWKSIKTLMKDIYAVDTTIFNKDGVWWLFVNIRENEGASSSDELFLFYSSDLFSEHWTPHPKNPIISDIKSSRPAGKIFLYNGNIYRPSQNNIYRYGYGGYSYGYGMKINQIVTLTKSEYKEVDVNDIEPLWDKKIVATHTINYLEGLTVIDGLMKRAKFFTFHRL